MPTLLNANLRYQNQEALDSDWRKVKRSFSASESPGPFDTAFVSTVLIELSLAGRRLGFSPSLYKAVVAHHESRLSQRQRQWPGPGPDSLGPSSSMHFNDSIIFPLQLESALTSRGHSTTTEVEHRPSSGCGSRGVPPAARIAQRGQSGRGQQDRDHDSIGQRPPRSAGPGCQCLRGGHRDPGHWHSSYDRPGPSQWRGSIVVLPWYRDREKSLPG